MALIEGIHILGHGDKGEARRIAPDIQQYQRLLVGTGELYGAGAYARYPPALPANLQDAPQVLFHIDEMQIIPICDRKTGTPRGFFRIPGAIGDYVTIQVLQFKNLW